MKGWLEILLAAIALLALVGPKTLQLWARDAGRGAGRANKMKDKVIADLSIDDIKKASNALSKVPRNSQDVVKMLLTSDDEKKDEKKSDRAHKSVDAGGANSGDAKEARPVEATTEQGKA
jgi:Sec-independent protein translocase protein TatA